MTRLKIGFTLLLLVAAILVLAPTVVFWELWDFKAVAAHWAWVAFLLGLMFLGVLLIFSGRSWPGRPDPRAQGPRARLRFGVLAFGLVAAVLVFAPTVVFGMIFGPEAIVAYWAAVILLAAMTFVGLFLIFTDKSLGRPKP